MANGTEDVVRVARAIVLAVTREIEQLGAERSATIASSGPASIRAPFYHMEGATEVVGSSVETVYPVLFRRMRSLVGVPEADFIADWKLDASASAKKGSGKSGSLFASSISKRFMLKTIPRREKQTILEFLPQYLNHAERNPRSFIMRLVGFYVVTLSSRTVNILVFGNTLYDPAQAPIKELYDLKGRQPKPSKLKGDSHGSTISDNTIGARVFSVAAPVAAAIVEQIERDTSFLATQVGRCAPHACALKRRDAAGTLAPTYACSHAPTRAYALARSHARKHTTTHTHMHTRTHTHMHTHMHTHGHTCAPPHAHALRAQRRTGREHAPPHANHWWRGAGGRVHRVQNLMDYSLLVGVRERPPAPVSAATGTADQGNVPMVPVDTLSTHNLGPEASAMRMSDPAELLAAGQHAGFASATADEVYFIGVIDLLTQYSKRKVPLCEPAG